MTAASSHSFMIQPPCTLPAMLASWMPVRYVSTETVSAGREGFGASGGSASTMAGGGLLAAHVMRGQEARRDLRPRGRQLRAVLAQVAVGDQLAHDAVQPRRVDAQLLADVRHGRAGLLGDQ